MIQGLGFAQAELLVAFGQFINPNHLHTLAQLQVLYGDASLVELNKSYRSTYEIITFLKGIGQVEKLEAIEQVHLSPQRCILIL